MSVDIWARDGKDYWMNGENSIYMVCYEAHEIIVEKLPVIAKVVGLANRPHQIIRPKVYGPLLLEVESAWRDFPHGTAREELVIVPSGGNVNPITFFGCLNHFFLGLQRARRLNKSISIDGLC